MAQGFVHTVYKNDQWINEVEDGDEICGVHATKEEAVRAGRARPQQDKQSTSSTTKTVRSASATRTATIR